MRVGAIPVGEALTWAYPDGDSGAHYVIPTYNMTVEGVDRAGRRQTKEFEVLRFGLLQRAGAGAPTVVGLADRQTHIIKQWIPTYVVHSAGSKENGAWQVYDNFLIHDGPDDPTNEVFATIGCIEICNGPEGFVVFNDLLIELSQVDGADRDQKLATLGRSKKLQISYDAARRPMLGTEVPAFRAGTKLRRPTVRY